jgi:hypothetical protein
MLAGFVLIIVGIFKKTQSHSAVEEETTAAV